MHYRNYLLYYSMFPRLTMRTRATFAGRSEVLTQCSVRDKETLNQVSL